MKLVEEFDVVEEAAAERSAANSASDDMEIVISLFELDCMR